ncbi:hypothetical protein OU787_14885 [Kitasatospora sp. YST-16]|uniref:hypothetical protein n=1 Tax=Kitasatospora sp. YST-16 TaxID=2998080 RepID=UPI0022846F98|nr:hypothetical protein [Kitasatospora sp. YST-16]WAL76632.1 hypothetical protein OU787_14885 [Kitasatospora sp. YST-16]WNW42638.1 hypothetical protein RKE32_14830 [Streptomyces sp. Li-HN-5-13]
MTDVRPSQQMQSLGVIQEGTPILAMPAHPFDLPTEREAAEQVIEKLFTALERIGRSTPLPGTWASRHRRSGSAGPPPSSSPLLRRLRRSPDH